MQLVVFDAAGRTVRPLVDGVQGPATLSVEWDGTSDAGTRVASGVSWARMTTSHGFDAATKLVLLK